MSLVSGPGVGGATINDLLDEPTLHVENHVKYIQSLDTVCLLFHFSLLASSTYLAHTLIAKRRTRILVDRTSTTQWIILGSDGFTSTWSSCCATPRRDHRFRAVVST